MGGPHLRSRPAPPRRRAPLPAQRAGRRLLPRVRDNARGVTLLEVLVAVAVMGLILGPTLYVMTQGTRTEASTRRQFSQQEQAYRVLREIVDGRDEVPGLRQARAVSINGGLSFLAGSSSATYYLADGKLYRKVCPVPPCAVEDPVTPSGGTEVLADVQAFQVTRSGRLLTITLEVRTPATGTGGSATGVRLTTKVLGRNLP